MTNCPEREETLVPVHYGSDEGSVGGTAYCASTSSRDVMSNTFPGVCARLSGEVSPALGGERGADSGGAAAAGSVALHWPPPGGADGDGPSFLC